jgi:peroxiredoxin
MSRVRGTPGRRAGAALVALALGLGSLGAAAAPDAEKAQGAALDAAARRAFDQFQAGDHGGWESSAARPAIQALWDFGRAHRAHEAGTEAAATALRLLDRLGRTADLKAKVESLGIDEAGWHRYMLVLLWSAEASGDFSYFVSKAQWLVASSPDALLRAQLCFTLGRYYRGQSQRQQAEAAYTQSAELSPDPELAAAARGMLYEMRSLGRGQMAPEFTAPLLGGETWSLEKMHGKVVVLRFWSTPCAQCDEELAQLDKLRRQREAKGLALLGIAVRTPCASVRQVVAQHATPWPQTCDSEANPGQLARLYNADDTPAYFVIDRDGVIVGSKVVVAELDEIVDTALAAAAAP